MIKAVVSYFGLQKEDATYDFLMRHDGKRIYRVWPGKFRMALAKMVLGKSQAHLADNIPPYRENYISWYCDGYKTERRWARIIIDDKRPNWRGRVAIRLLDLKRV